MFALWSRRPSRAAVHLEPTVAFPDLCSPSRSSGGPVPSCPLLSLGASGVPEGTGQQANSKVRGVGWAQPCVQRPPD